ncbi:MAG: amidohydrolase [Owenweeksia sp.]|nr:amidohydrolase [Owenweeksia sp.]
MNGLIYTLDSSFSQVEAMAVKDGKVVAIGSSEALRHSYRAPQELNLKGQVVYPGFNDAHAHFYGYAQSLIQVNLVGTRSYQEVLNRTQAFAKEHQPKFISGRGSDQTDWGTVQFPHRKALDSLFPKTPVLLKRIDGHAALANQAALDFAGIKADTSVPGGVLMKQNGRLTGVLIDRAVDLVQFPETPTTKKSQAIRWAQDSLLKYGLTSVTDAGLNLEQIQLIEKLQEAGQLRLRINAMVSDTPELLEHFLERGMIKNDRLKVQCFKFYLDGALGSRGALMLRPYADDSLNYGLSLTGEAHFKEALASLKTARWQAAVHAIGDSANRQVLNLYKEILGDATKMDHRWRVEHAQVVHEDDVARFGEIGAIPSVQPTHATSDMYWAEQRLGAAGMEEAYPYKDLLAAAGVLPLGTDFPVEDIDPRKTFRAAVFRQDSASFPVGGFRPEQRLTREQTIRGMTIWGAYASFEEEQKGSLRAR